MKLVRIQATLHSYVVPNNPSAIDYAKEALYEDISRNALRNLWNNLVVVDAPDATENDIPDFILEFLEDEE